MYLVSKCVYYKPNIVIRETTSRGYFTLVDFVVSIITRNGHTETPSSLSYSEYCLLISYLALAS